MTDLAPDSHRTFDDDLAYPALLAAIRRRVARARGPLFTTDATALYDAFLDGLPAARRQVYRCHACRRFVARYGGLVTIAADGQPTAAMWDPDAAPAPFAPAIAALARRVICARVTGVFLDSAAVWGTPTSPRAADGTWHHLAVEAGALAARPSPLATCGQRMAALRDDFALLQQALARYTRPYVAQAVTLLTTGNLAHAEKCLGAARWLLALHDARLAHPGRATHLTWAAVATAPPGFCHVQGGVLGTLLDDLLAGVRFDALKASFEAKLHPLQYQRPQAAPRAGNIAQAEAVVAKLAAEGALARRFARLEDVPTMWTPRPTEPVRGGVFAHLRARVATPARPTQPAVTMTWDKFARTVLPDARRVQYLVPASHASYGALITAADPSAAPILQWDRPDRRNPVSWYVYVSGSAPATWNLRRAAYVDLTAVVLQPTLWDPAVSYAHHGQAVFLILAGARDTSYRQGAGFFPAFLKSDYHAVRATLEAHAKGAVVADAERATACGLRLTAGVPWDCALRVTSATGVVDYRLDRWD